MHVILSVIWSDGAAVAEAPLTEYDLKVSVSIPANFCMVAIHLATEDGLWGSNRLELNWTPSGNTLMAFNFKFDKSFGLDGFVKANNARVTTGLKWEHRFRPEKQCKSDLGHFPCSGGLGKGVSYCKPLWVLLLL